MFDAREIQGELWLAGRLGIDDLYAGATTREKRRERLREEILSRGLSQAVLGRGKEGLAETYSRAFERLYGQAL